MEKSYLIRSADYLKMGIEILEQVGVSAAHAAILMENFLDCDRKGIFTHGIFRLPTYLKQMKRGNINPQPDIRIVKDDPAVVLMDGDAGLGAVVSYYAMQAAIDICSRQGIGVVGVRNSNHFGAAAYYTEMASRANYIGIAFTNASPAIAPTGSLQPLLGNNPWSISVPTNLPYPITMDIANSVVARGKIRIAKSKGETIPLGWALNKYGQPTTDPQEALDGGAILPIGDYKGYCITFMLDGIRNNGHLFIALDIEKFMSVEEFKRRVDELVRMVKSLPRIKEDQEILLPGEIEWRRKLSQAEGTVKLTEQIFQMLHELSTEYGVNLPEIQVVGS